MENKKLIKWLLSDDTGSSSKAIVSWMTGLKSGYFSPPFDRGDRGRCIRLMQIMPEWYARLDEMSYISENWKEQIALIKEEYYKLDY